jgi:hypothetical protein
MATLQINRFNSWILSAHEEKEGSLLSDLSLKRIQNLQAQAAIKQSNMVMSLERVGEVALEHAYLKGQIDFAQFLIDSHMAELIVVNTPLGKE